VYNGSHYPVGHGYPILPPDRTFFHPTSGKRNSRKFIYEILHSPAPIDSGSPL
jgi:hypothetical protein